jgi:NADH-ubiquinone oxidoreductase chain 5
VGPYGLATVLSNTGLNISKLDTGIVTSYALYIVLGLISIVLIIFLPVFVTSDIRIFNVSEIRLVIILVTALLFALNH